MKIAQKIFTIAPLRENFLRKPMFFSGYLIFPLRAFLKNNSNYSLNMTQCFLINGPCFRELNKNSFCIILYLNIVIH